MRAKLVNKPEGGCMIETYPDYWLRRFHPDDEAAVMSWLTSEKSFFQRSAGRFGGYPAEAAAMFGHYGQNEGFVPLTFVRDTEESLSMMGDKIWVFNRRDHPDGTTEAVGHLAMRPYGDSFENTLLCFIVVNSEERGKGLGSKMLAAAERYARDKFGAKKLFLRVFENNPAAYRCYLKAGFRETGNFHYAELMGEKWRCIEMSKDIEMLELRPYYFDDAETIYKWVTSEESFRQWSSDRINVWPLTAQAINDYYNTEGEKTVTHMTMVAKQGLDGKPVGHMILRYPDPEDKTHVRFGFVIVDNTIRGKGYGKKMLMLAERYAVENMGAKKLSLGVFENNPSAYNCYKACGFNETDNDWNCEFFGETWRCIELEKKLTDE